jgi:uncharacterized protein (TIGR03382 family)
MRPQLIVRSLAVLAAAGALAPSSRAAYISDPSFFAPFPTTLINFETDGQGNPITLIQGQRLAMPSNAYAPQGVTFTGVGSPVYWVNDGNAAFDAAQILEGSPVNSIPSSLCNQFTLTFATPVRAFGFFVCNNRTADPIGPSFVAKDAQGNVIDTANWDSKFIHGTTTGPNTTADYGFMGLSTGTPIASVTITKQAAIFDDLHFTQVPTPGVLSLGAAAGVAVLRRRRR